MPCLLPLAGSDLPLCTCPALPPLPVQVLRTAGPRSLYYGFIPYCLESWPYDISELLVVGAASDVRGASPSARAITPAAWDLAVGGLAGTVAVSTCRHKVLV